MSDLTTKATHWDSVYGARSDDALTWFEAEPAASLNQILPWIRPGDAVIDVGGGTSRLVDALVARGLGPVTVLDLSAAALRTGQERLGDAAKSVRWIAADVTRWTPDASYRVWHDRAVFHFLTDASDRAAYVAALQAAVAPGGIAVIATFAEDGPDTCSGLPVCRYSPDAFMETVESISPRTFKAMSAIRHTHITPKGNQQRFQITTLQRV